MLQLVGKGKLGLDDAIETWLPGVVAGEGYDATKITVRQLLQHTSGVHNYTADLLDPTFDAAAFERMRGESHDPAKLVANALAHGPDFAPGTSWSYSNTNYLLLGMLVERLTGRNWRAEVKSHIVDALGLEDTYDPEGALDIHGPHASGYEQFVEGGPLVDVTRANQTFADAAGSLISTTHDLAIFFRALQQGRLLGPREMVEMHRTVPAPPLAAVVPGVEYGLGIMRIPGPCGRPYWSHFGDTFGYATRDAVSDDGRRVFVVSLTTNLAGEAALDVIGATVRLLDDAMCKVR